MFFYLFCFSNRSIFAAITKQTVQKFNSDLQQIQFMHPNLPNHLVSLLQEVLNFYSYDLNIIDSIQNAITNHHLPSAPKTQKHIVMQWKPKISSALNKEDALRFYQELGFWVLLEFLSREDADYKQATESVLESFFIIFNKLAINKTNTENTQNALNEIQKVTHPERTRRDIYKSLIRLTFDEMKHPKKQYMRHQNRLYFYLQLEELKNQIPDIHKFLTMFFNDNKSFSKNLQEIISSASTCSNTSVLTRKALNNKTVHLIIMMYDLLTYSSKGMEAARSFFQIENNKYFEPDHFSKGAEKKFDGTCRKSLIVFYDKFIRNR
jgi:hypothetical protein